MEFPIDSSNHLQLAMAVFNNHIFHAWWRVWGDAFHLTNYLIESMPIPDLWFDDQQIKTEAQHIGKQLEQLLDHSDNITRNRTGTKSKEFENINYHDTAPALIEQADRLYLKALNITDREAELTLTELHKMRSNSNWKYD